MTTAASDDDALGVRLSWPSDHSAGTEPRPPAGPPASATDGDDGDGSVTGPAGGAELARAPRDGALATEGPATGLGLVSRLDALIASTTSLRSLLGDRLIEFNEQIGRTSRAHAADLEDYRHSTERVVGEIRRSTLDSEEAMHRLAGRMEEIGVDLAGLIEVTRASIDEGRDLTGSVDRMSKSVRDGLEGFTTRVLERLDASRHDLDANLAAVRADATRLRQAITDAAAGWNAERADVAAELVREEIAGLRGEVAALRAAVAPDADGVEGLVTEIQGRTEVAALRRRLAVRSQSSEAQADAIATAVTDRLVEMLDFGTPSA